MAPPALDELMKKEPRLSKSDLEYLQEWISKQPHFPPLDDLEIVPSLNCCDYSLERTKEHLEKYLTMRTHAPELFKFRDPRISPLKDQFKFFHGAAVSRDTKGRHIICAGWNPQDISTLDIDAVTYIAFSLVELVVRNNPTDSSFIFVMNASELSAGHMAKMSLTLIKKVVAFAQEGILARIEAIHVIGLNSMLDKLMMIVKPLLSKKTQDMLYFHSKNMDSFYEAVPKSLLPKDYGGTLPPIEEFYKKIIEELVENAEWLKSLDKRVVDESKRPGRAKGEGDVFGVEGSFKKLEVD